MKEPPNWVRRKEHPRIRELFKDPILRMRTFGGLAMASTALITWWSCNAFLPSIASFLVQDLPYNLSRPETAAMSAAFVKGATTWFNLGGLFGTLLTIPVALYLGRRPMFFIYFSLSALSIWTTFRFDLEPETRLLSTFFVGLSVFGIFGSFTFYLPELFPTRVRATGSGFCYNVGRFITAIGPFAVGEAAHRANSSQDILQVVSWVALVPAFGVLLLLMGFGQETKGLELGEK